MGVIAKDPSLEYELAPAGIIPAVCVTYFDCGRQKSDLYGIQHKIVLLWELDARNNEGARFTITKSYVLYLLPKATLTADLQSWRGKAFSDEERKGFDMDNVIGKPCQLSLIHTVKSNGAPWVSVNSVLPPPKGWKPFSVETAPDYIPSFVATWMEKQIVAPDTRTDPAAGRDTYVDDDIPF